MNPGNKLYDTFLSAMRNILYYILPQKCLNCSRIGEIICDHCLQNLSKESNIYGVKTFLPYSNPSVQKAIWLLKYRGVTEAAKPFAKILHEKLIEDLADMSQLLLNSQSKIILIPVPLSKERLRERGFNQSEVILKELIRIDQSNSLELGSDILEKVKDTPTQVGIKDRVKRQKNLIGVFRLGRDAKNEIGQKIVLLFDDVTTTGTTLNECAKVLRQAKPKKIIKVAVAH